MGGKKTKNVGTLYLQKVQKGLQVVLIMLTPEEENKTEGETEQDEPANSLYQIHHEFPNQLCNNPTT